MMSEKPIKTKGGIAVYSSKRLGNPLIVLPGGPALSSRLYRSAFENQTGPASKRDFVFFDYFNVGGSAKSPTNSFVQDLESVYEATAHLGLQRFSILGHSYGGLLALKVAIDNPDRVTELFLANTASNFAPLLTGIFERKARKLQPLELQKAGEIFGRLQAGNLSADDTREFCRIEARCHFLNPGPSLVNSFIVDSEINLGAFAAHQDWMGLDLTSELGSIKARTVVVTSDNDIVVPPEYSRALSEKIPGAKTVTFQNSGHWPFVEEMEKFAKILG